MKVAIVTNKPYQACETFIKSQVDNLPFEKVHFWGAKIPLSTSDEIYDPTTVKNRIRKKLGWKSDLELQIQSFKKYKIEVVLAEYGTMGIEVLAACKALQIPLVVHFHGHDAVRKTIIERFKYEYIEMFNEAFQVISVSHEMTKRLQSIGCPKEKISYNTYGPHDKFLEISPEFSKRQFIAIGRFVEKKAPHLLILSFSKVVLKFPEAVLVIAGNGMLLDSCKNLVDGLQLENNVIFPGLVSPDQYIQYLSESIAFVQHSIEAPDGDMEGTPVAMLEASGAGLPVISTRHAGIPDIVLEGETGMLCDEKDIDAMAENMMWIIEHKAQAIEMGKKGKERISGLFSLDHHIQGLVGILNKAILAK